MVYQRSAQPSRPEVIVVTVWTKLMEKEKKLERISRLSLSLGGRHRPKGNHVPEHPF